MKPYKTLGIETSCDETAAAVYQSNKGILSNVLYSQIAQHHEYGGVMPEIAARSHLEKMPLIIEQALKKADCSLNDIDVVAVTYKPGLPGSLLIGLCYGKAIAWAAGKKFIGINHLEGHAFSALIENEVPFPHLCLTASGGHTSLYLIHELGNYEILAQTRDDAAGEAFDKIAKLLGLGYPGGPVIEKLAQEVNFKDFFHYPRNNPAMIDFSFSGLKTAVLYNLVAQGICDLSTKQLTVDAAHLHKIQQEVASSLLVCIADIFKQKIIQALAHHNIKALTFVGGVACNKYIKKELEQLCAQHNLLFFAPSPQYCTDNAAMIAFVGNYKAQQGKFSDWSLDILE